MFYIVLIEPEHPGNIGACARVMKNFGFNNLVLIDSQVPVDGTAEARAKHAKDVLKKATKTDKSFLDDMDYIIGTTAKLGTDYNLTRSPVHPSDIAKRINKKNTALLIGREGTGLSNDELKKCDLVVTIPANTRYPTLNISHALAVILYEISKTDNQYKRIEPANRNDMNLLVSFIEKSVDSLPYSAHRKKVLKAVWNRIIGKAALTKREAFALMGHFKKET